MNQLHEALKSHTATPELTSKANIKKNFEAAWLSARSKTIESNGLNVDIILAAIMNMEIRVRSKLITTEQYNSLCNIAMAAQSSLALVYSHDPRAAVLHARLVEAHRNISSTHPTPF